MVSTGRAKYFHSMRIRIVAFLVAHDGTAEGRHLRALLRQHGVDQGSIRRPNGKSDGAIAGRYLNRLMRPLVDDEIVHKGGEDRWSATISDLVDWLADAVPDDYEPLDWREKPPD